MDGELGQATPTYASIPIAVPTPFPIWVQMDGGWNVLYARSTSGQIAAAGSGTNGGLGNGTTTPSNGWAMVSSIKSASTMAAGKQGGMAILP